MFKSGEYGLCFSCWIFTCFKNVVVLLHMWRRTLSHRRTISFRAIGFLRTWLKRLLVSLRSWMVTSELTVCPRGSKVSEKPLFFAGNRYQKHWFTFRYLSLGYCGFGLLFLYPGIPVLLLIPNKTAFVFNNVM